MYTITHRKKVLTCSVCKSNKMSLTAIELKNGNLKPVCRMCHTKLEFEKRKQVTQ